MVRYLPVGYDEALELTLGQLTPLQSETVNLSDCVGRIAACEMKAQVDSPSVDASLKDGFAVQSRDLVNACADHPVGLKVIGSIAAGAHVEQAVAPGTAMRVLTGAKMPKNADAVLSEEFARVQEDSVVARKGAEPGRNILRKGSDVRKGQTILSRGEMISPGQAGLLAAAGHSQVPVIQHPVVAIIATGDEVVAPGRPLGEGKLYASNLITLNAWCRRYGMQSHLTVVKDDPQALRHVLNQAVAKADAIITSGGAWTGDRDMVVQVLSRMNWRQVFHRIRIGPGKAVGFGLLKDKAVFILPGGPPSNLMGFLQIALPGLLRLGGHRQTGLPTILAQLSTQLVGRYADWTQFFYGVLEYNHQKTLFHPLRKTSRLQSMAEAQAIVAIPEGRTSMPAGEVVLVQTLT